jgi:hypothetical protein
MREEDPNSTLKLVNLAFEAIKVRLEVLPNGLADLQEMKEIKVALGQLLRLRDHTLRNREKQDRRTALASTLRRLIRAT